MRLRELPLLPVRFLLWLARWLLLDPWRELDGEAAAYRSGEGAALYTKDALLVFYIFAVVTISLTVQWYFGDPDAFYAILAFVDDPTSPILHPVPYAIAAAIFKPDGGGSAVLALATSERWELWNLLYWAAWRVIGFLVIPAIAVAVHPRLRFADTGLSARGFSKHVWLYGVLFAPVLIAVVVVSFTDEFSTYYPFYGEAHRSLFDFGVWEAFYFAQFLSLEYFFRGFMIQPLRRIMGSSSVFAMVIPYVMIHFDKPMLECFAAIIAGVVLGTLALRTRSIWAGFLIHVSVALSMDVAAILQTHGIPWR
ncbi:MAG: CPBP family intramembrane metalloprotease [Proteobacteria bacterium]|nr:CPBP family intramembrane metalloprotease [Pseudomonadota bacterium]